MEDDEEVCFVALNVVVCPDSTDSLGTVSC